MDSTKALILAALEKKLEAVNIGPYGNHKGDWRQLRPNEIADAVITALSEQGEAAQPAAEPIGYITPDDVSELKKGRIGGHVFPKGTLRPENEVAVYVSPITSKENDNARQMG